MQYLFVHTLVHTCLCGFLYSGGMGRCSGGV